jgi:hypothetical protein
MDRKQLERWLADEERGHEEAADAAFAQLIAAVPRIEPRPAFIGQAVTAAWQWRARRRRLVVVGWAAASVLVAAGALAAYLASPSLAPVFIKALAFVSGHAVPWFVSYTTVAMNSWFTLLHVGSVIASALMTPARTAALVGVELFGLLAFFALQRIAGVGRFGDAQV